jgi:hypothetical protein
MWLLWVTLMVSTADVWSPQKIKCRVNGPENHDPISMQIYLNKQNGDKGRANTMHVRKPHKLDMKKRKIQSMPEV